MTDELAIIDTIPLDKQTGELAQKIIDEQDIDKVKDLTALFNLNQNKKNVVRVMKLNSLLDTISDSIIDRFEKRPGEFSNEDLIKYMQVTENAIDRANKSLALVDETPAIQLQQNNQTNINVQFNSLDRESRERVADAVKALLAKANQEQINFKEDN